MTDGPRWAKLELLIRTDDESFEVREVPSSAAWLAMQPQRVDDGGWELAELSSLVDRQRRFVLKNTRTERFLMLSEPERFLWDRMDGQTSLQDLATAYVLRYGAFDFDLIPGLIGKLQRAQFLTFQPASALRRALARNRRWRVVQIFERVLVALERVTVSSRRVQPLFERLYRAGGFLLFTRSALLACVVLAAVGAVAAMWLWRELDDVARGLGSHPLAAIIIVKLLFLATLALHQGVHGLACVHYRRRVREFGFTFLHGFVPTFYVDVTDIFMATRRARIVTALCGPFVHLVLGALWFVLAATAPAGFVQAFAAASALIQWQAFIVALYPFCFIEMDGYHILVDVLGVPTLKQDAIAYVGSLFRGAPAAPWGRPARLWVAYVVISSVSVALFVAFNTWMVMRAI